MWALGYDPKSVKKLLKMCPTNHNLDTIRKKVNEDIINWKKAYPDYKEDLY